MAKKSDGLSAVPMANFTKKPVRGRRKKRKASSIWLTLAFLIPSFLCVGILTLWFGFFRKPAPTPAIQEAVVIEAINNAPAQLPQFKRFAGWSDFDYAIYDAAVTSAAQLYNLPRWMIECLSRRPGAIPQPRNAMSLGYDMGLIKADQLSNISLNVHTGVKWLSNLIDTGVSYEDACRIWIYGSHAFSKGDFNKTTEAYLDSIFGKESE